MPSPSCAAWRHLHSSPTRRSSDLEMRVSIGNGDIEGLGSCGGFHGAPDRGHPDRKSTRLNSSHLGISHAISFLCRLATSTLFPYTTLFRSRNAREHR